MTKLPNGLHTGKAPASHDERDLKLANYLKLAPSQLIVPDSFGWGWLIPDNQWQMLGNGPDDSVAPGFGGAGDCVWAGADHETVLEHVVSGKRDVPIFTGAQTIADYSAATGYDPQSGANDNGTDVREAMKYRQSTGVVDAAGTRHTIGAYLSLEPGNTEHLYAALLIFGVVGIGIEFPDYAMQQFDNGQPWDVQPGGSIEGGHYIPVVSRRPHGLHVVTWGRNIIMTTAFYQQYCDEAWCYVNPELLTSHGVTRKAMGLLNLDQLNADLAGLAS